MTDLEIGLAWRCAAVVAVVGWIVWEWASNDEF